MNIRECLFLKFYTLTLSSCVFHSLDLNKFVFVPLFLCASMSVLPYKVGLTLVSVTWILCPGTRFHWRVICIILSSLTRHMYYGLSSNELILFSIFSVLRVLHFLPCSFFLCPHHDLGLAIGCFPFKLTFKTVKADSHIACRAHAVPLPCRAAKGLECVSHLIYTVRPCLIHKNVKCESDTACTV
jgi:hypothetical protein